MHSLRRHSPSLLAFRASLAVLTLLTVAGSVPIFACASRGGPDPQIETGRHAEVTADGLVRIRNTGFAHAWVKPGVVFADFDSVALAPLLVAYKRAPRSHGTPSTIEGNHLLNEQQLATFKRYFTDAFQREFSRDGAYELIVTPTDRTLILVPAIVDLVMLVSTDTNRIDESFSSSTALMTLLLDVRDARTGEVVARIAERRAARTPGSEGTNSLYRSDFVNTATAFRSTFGNWAGHLRDYLDRARQLAPIVAEPSPPV